MAGKKILTQFALPVGSTSGDFGNGTAGQVLTTGGDSASMYWADAGSTSGGDKVRLSTTTLTNARFFTLTPTFSSTYDVYEIYFHNCIGTGSTTTSPHGFIMRAYAGDSELTSGYEYYSDASINEGGTDSSIMGSDDANLSFWCAALDRGEFSGKVTLYNPTDLNSYKFIESRFQSRVLDSNNYYANDTGTKYWNTFGSVNASSEDLSKVKFYCIRGDVVTGPPTWGVSGAGVSGKVSVYGLKKS